MIDPRDQMQAEHDALLSEHSAFQAPAAMPSEEEMLAAYNAVWQSAPSITAHNVDIVRREALSAVRALFAPILAEKERDALRRQTVALAQAQDWRNEAGKAEARALAAEAALAAVEQAIRNCPSLDENGYICEKAAAIAAIRAQGE